MKNINFIGLSNHSVLRDDDRRGWALLMHCASADFDYNRDVYPLLEKEGLYASEEQYEAVCVLFNEQHRLDMEEGDV